MLLEHFEEEFDSRRSGRFLGDGVAPKRRWLVQPVQSHVGYLRPYYHPTQSRLETSVCSGNRWIGWVDQRGCVEYCGRGQSFYDFISLALGFLRRVNTKDSRSYSTGQRVQSHSSPGSTATYTGRKGEIMCGSDIGVFHQCDRESGRVAVVGKSKWSLMAPLGLTGTSARETGSNKGPAVVDRELSSLFLKRNFFLF